MLDNSTLLHKVLVHNDGAMANKYLVYVNCDTPDEAMSAAKLYAPVDDFGELEIDAWLEYRGTVDIMDICVDECIICNG